MNVSKYSGKLVESDFQNEAAKAIEKLEQLNDSVVYLNRRYSDPKVPYQERFDLPDESAVVGAAFLGMYGYCDGGEDAKSSRSKKLMRLQKVLEKELESMWDEHRLQGGNIGSVDGVLQLARDGRLFLVVLSNREAYCMTACIGIAKALHSIQAQIANMQGQQNVLLRGILLVLCKGLSFQIQSLN